MTQELQIKEKPETAAVPKLRFREYVDNFETHFLKDLIEDLQSGISVNSEDYAIQKNTEAGILKTNCVTEGVFYSKENKKIISEEISRAKLNPRKGEIIISRMNTPQLVGESGYVSDDFPNLFIPDRLWQSRVDTNKCNSRWLSYFLITKKVRNNLKAIATGTSGTMKNISKPNFLGIKTQIPSLNEQQKIASFLSAVDKKLQQLKRKKELLETYKKGVMQQLFSQEIRFKDENGKELPPWKEKKLGSICEMTSSKRVYLSDYVAQGVPFFRGKEISALGLNKIPDDVLYISDERYQEYKRKYGIPLINDILITAVGTLGNVLRIKNDIPFYFKDGNLIWFRNISESSEFLEYLLNWNHRSILNSAIGSSQKALTMIELRKLKFNFPSLEEQQKIAGFLSAIDKKVEAVSQQISQTHSFKKGLLQQMFV